MANYSLVINSKFRPFTYQELTAPLDRQDAYHEKLMDEYDKLSAQADVLEAMGKNDRDKSVYQKYKLYSDTLRAEAENLYRNGLNSDSRMRLSQLRRMYSSDIIPIQNAWNKREKEAELQLKAKMDAAAKGIDLYFSRDASDTDLQKYIDNPNQDFSIANGQQITSEVSNIFKGMANQVQRDKDGNYFIQGKPLSEIERSIITQKGMDYNKFADFMANPDNPEYSNIKGIINNVLIAHGAQNYDPQTQQRLFWHGAMGVSSAVGNRDAQLSVDPYKKALLDHQLELEKELYKAQLKENELADTDIPNITSTSVGTEASEHYSAEGLKKLESLKTGKDSLKASYFGKTGQVNPLAVYEEYNNASGKDAKEKVLQKYSKYGVTDILTKDQYNLLTDMGYSNKKNPTSDGITFSSLTNKFNSTVKRYNRFSVNMTKYDNVHDTISGNLAEMSRYNSLAGRLWEIEEDGKKGNPIKDAEKLKLALPGASTGNRVNGIFYDPRFKKKIVFRTTDGKTYVADPEVISNELAKKINDMENAKDAKGNRVYSEKEIAGAIYKDLNIQNKVQSETDSKV